MNWDKIKEVLKRYGGKVILLEDGQPTYIISRIDDTQMPDQDADLSKVNQELEVLSSDQKQAEVDKREPDIKVEDLPF